MYKLNKVLDAALVAVISYHLLIAPYTKVEESFNIQAIHDIVNYGIFPKSTVENNYDHIKFPGVVPRTFVGSLVIALIVKAFNVVSAIFGYDLINSEGSQLELQLVVRGVLGLANAFALLALRDSVNRITVSDKKSKRKGVIGFWFSVLLLTQFHLLFYSTRTLPNFIALPLVTYGVSKLVEGNIYGYSWLAFTGIVFRAEVGLFGVIIALVSAFAFGQSSILVNLISLAAGTIFGGLTSMLVDSYFWGRLLLPELESFFFNIVEGKASEWGVEPWSAYFTEYSLQLFRPPVILLLLLPGLISDPADDGTSIVEQAEKKKVTHPARHSLRILFTSSILFVAAMSFQPHKEWRFIIYIVPVLILQAANGLTGLSMKWSYGWSTKLLVFIIVCNIFLSTLMSLTLGYVSKLNYPGGDALSFVNEYITTNYKNESVFIHSDVAACMSGVTRFGEIHSSLITYDKTEVDFELNEIWDKIDIIITEQNIENTQENQHPLLTKKDWDLIHVSPVFKAVTVRPLVELFFMYKRDNTILQQLGKRIVQEALEGKVTVLKNFFVGFLATRDYLYVYERVDDEAEESSSIVSNESQIESQSEAQTESATKQTESEIEASSESEIESSTESATDSNSTSEIESEIESSSESEIESQEPETESQSESSEETPSEATAHVQEVQDPIEEINPVKIEEDLNSEIDSLESEIL